MGPRPLLRFWEHIIACLAQEHTDHMGSSPHLWFCACKTETLGLQLKVSFGPRPHLFVLCMQNSVICTRITSLYGFQPSSVVFACKTAPFGPELQVSMGPRHHLSICACKTAWLASELLVYMVPSLHLWFLDAKERILDQNNKSLWGPDITCHFVRTKLHD